VDETSEVLDYTKLNEQMDILHAWNINNPNHKVDIHTPMPDYKKL
jgi:hypothetical protein